ncbi:uncharacterized protein EAF01_010412 [Botrytis porri]|uniref:uncharacterized protein n=1 Tax=Botrytis porri TaxID=87229 RepID=UPI001900C79B|nr:uncharacterized protein EAF01_010412 [Botrytis porri]KAF7892332.1 hypothetical protein EAF01_010412 [Botrytis porri]
MMAHLSDLIDHIPRSDEQERSTLKCCCGRKECAFLLHNGEVLDKLEGDVTLAAQMGQALLERHEHYMLDAERERAKMTAKIEQLEVDKKELERKNEKTIEENKALLDQLEGLNDSYEESEVQIKLLESTLQSTRTEMKRLETLASRTYQLERDLAILEEEQETLRKTIIHTAAEERTAILRWKRAERGLCDLQDQLERIEREAQEERERHVEILGRMERQRTVERELDTAACRLKGAAAATSGRGKHGTSVVSHFVKDILQDNANLQLGIVELREMLMNSNDEVQTLREQLLMHQPMYAEDGDNVAQQRTLGAELAPSEPDSEQRPQEPQVISQALHIHHHYHVPKREEARKPKKKRTSLNSGIFPPFTRSPQSPRISRGAENAILAQTAVTVPSPINTNNRWSVQSSQLSEFAPSSVPSSPQSMYRSSALFDRSFDIDSSRPTSPTSSIDPLSPRVHPSYHRKRPSEVSTRSFSAISNFQPHNIIHEEEDDDDSRDVSDLQFTRTPSLTDDSTNPTTSDVSDNTIDEWIPRQFGPRLHRSPSHESIVSISGIDIHTLKTRPSQINMTSAGSLRPQSRLSTPTMTYSTETITGASMITARPTLSRTGHDSTSYLRSNIGHSSSPRSTSNDRSSIRSSSSNEGNHSSTGLGKKVGGWVFGRWGMSPTKSTNDLRSSSKAHVPVPPPTIRAVSTPSISITQEPLRAILGRAAGINQKGPIPGFRQTEKAPSKVVPDLVDRDALAEVLEE